MQVILGWMRLALFILIGSTIAFVLLRIYFRSLHRERLEETWDPVRHGADRSAWIEAGMRDHERSLRRRLLWLIYILPMIVISIIFFYSNWGGI